MFELVVSTDPPIVTTPITPITLTLTLWQWIVVAVGATLVILTFLITTTVSTRLYIVLPPIISIRSAVAGVLF